LRNLLKRPVT